MKGIPVSITAVEAYDAVVSGIFHGLVQAMLRSHKQLRLIFGLVEIARSESFDDENVVQIVAVLMLK